MDHYDLDLRMALGEKTYLPRKRERRMTAVDEDGFVVFFSDLHDRIDHRRIGRESVEKRLHLDTCELLVAQIVLQLVVSRLTEIRVDPAERDYFVGHLFESVVELFIQRACRRAEDRFFDIVFRHLFFQHVGIEIDIERASEKTDVRVCVDFFEFCEIVHFSSLPLPFLNQVIVLLSAADDKQ